MSRERRRYADFVLQIEPLVPGHYRAQVVESPAGVAEIDLMFPWLEGDLPTLPPFAEWTFRLPGTLAGEEVRRFGGELFRTFFSGPVEVAFRMSGTEAAARGQGLREPTTRRFVWW